MISKVHGYILAETLYEGAETQVRRATHEASDECVVIKLPTSETPSLRTLGRLAHEHRILTNLAPTPGIPKVRALEQQGGSAALILDDVGLRSLGRVLEERKRLPIEVALRVALGLC